MSEDLRVVKTKENIENSLLECLKTHKFRDITVKMIVEKSRINRSTFYHNYLDKYDLLEQLLGRLTNGLSECMSTSFVSLEYKNAPSYHPCLKPLLHFFETNRRAFTILWDTELPVDFSRELTDLFSSSLLHSMTEQYSITKENISFAMLYADLFASQTLATIRWWLISSSELSETELLKIMTANIEKGLFQSMENIFKTGKG